KRLTECYDKFLTTFEAKKPIWKKDATINYAYYSLVFESEKLMHKSIEILRGYEIFTRRYFYPSLANTLPYVEKQNFEVTDDIAKRVLCLPLYYDLTEEEVLL